MKLDLTQFEPLTWDEQRSESSHTYASQRLYAAMKDCAELLALAREQQQQIEKLRAALEKIAGGNVMGDETWTHADIVFAYQEKASAALAETGGA